jgi:hypothetical protein
MRSSHSRSAGVMPRRARWGRRSFVLALPRPKLPDQVVSIPERGATVELVLVGPMAALHLAIHFGASGRDAAMGDPQIVEVPGEVRAELGAVVRLNPLDGDREGLTQCLDEGDGRLDGVVVIDLQDAVSRGLVDGRELIQAAGPELDVLHVHLNRLSWDLELRAATRARAVALERDPGHLMRLEDPVDCRGRDADLMVPTQEETEPYDPVLPFLPDPEDQGLDLRRGAVRTRAGSARTVPEARGPLPSESVQPPVELVPRDPEEAAGLADVAGDLLVVLNHPEPGLGPTRLSVVGGDNSLHPGSPFRGTAHASLSVPDEP